MKPQDEIFERIMTCHSCGREVRVGTSGMSRTQIIAKLESFICKTCREGIRNESKDSHNS